MATTASITIDRVSLRKRSEESDLLAVEEPLEIRLSFLRSGENHSQSLSVTTRTPGDDRALTIGFMLTEGVVTSLDQIKSIEHDDGLTGVSDLTNVVQVTLVKGVTPDFEFARGHLDRTASGGLCGRASLEAAASKTRFPIDNSDMQLRPQALYPLPIRLAEGQGAFSSTGGINAAALFDVDGMIIDAREDVRKNNALNKLIGNAILDGGLPLTNQGVLVSGRASFELVRKAMMAGCPVVASVGAPSSLAVALAREMNMTLVGFLREGRFNIYAGAGRIL